MPVLPVRDAVVFSPIFFVFTRPFETFLVLIRSQSFILLVVVVVERRRKLPFPVCFRSSLRVSFTNLCDIARHASHRMCDGTCNDCCSSSDKPSKGFAVVVVVASSSSASFLRRSSFVESTSTRVFCEYIIKEDEKKTTIALKKLKSDERTKEQKKPHHHERVLPLFLRRSSWKSSNEDFSFSVCFVVE